MEVASLVCRVASIVAFLFYGLACLFTGRMVAEFERFGLARMRTLTGALEVLGALGLLAGFFVPPLVIVSSGGLALLMLLGVGVRVRVRDSLLEMLPAIVLLVANGFVCLHALGALPAPAPG